MCFFNLEDLLLMSLSDSFEYLCYWSTSIRNILILTVRGPSLYVKIWRLQTAPTLKGLKVIVTIILRKIAEFCVFCFAWEIRQNENLNFY